MDLPSRSPSPRREIEEPPATDDRIPLILESKDLIRAS